MADEEGSRDSQMPQPGPGWRCMALKRAALKAKMWPRRKRREAAKSAASLFWTAWPRAYNQAYICSPEADLTVKLRPRPPSSPPLSHAVPHAGASPRSDQQAALVASPRDPGAQARAGVCDLPREAIHRRHLRQHPRKLVPVQAGGEGTMDFGAQAECLQFGVSGGRFPTATRRPMVLSCLCSLMTGG